MVDFPRSFKRPVCPSYSKPTRICPCSRLQSPSLENSIEVIFLQHSLEKKHPLNSVNNLIVLNGTWAKAKRIYKENPWLRILPHMKLDLKNMSLFSEVRHQPKFGFFSTIALKVIKDHPEGLDGFV